MLKSLLSGFRKYPVAMGFTLFLFGIFTVVWFYVINRYTVLYYQEQIQLFRFDRFYFLSFLDRPGGLIEYVGAFLTQFYFYPFVGAIILTTVLTTVVLLFYQICLTPSPVGRVGEGSMQLFFIPFIPAVLLMTSFVNIFFDVSAALGILLVLAGFSWYIALSLPVRYGAGILLFAATWFIAGGNVLLLAALILIFELTGFDSSKEQTKKRDKFLYLLLLAGWGAGLPWLSMRLFYDLTVREAYFALTPATFVFPTTDSKLLWLSLPVLFLTGRLTASKTNRWNLSSIKAGVLNFLMVSVMTAGCVYLRYNHRTHISNIVNRMTFELQRSHFDSVVAAGKNNPGNNRLVCNLTNIALYESGQMPYRMFHYKQMGTAGLFLDWKFASDSNLAWYLGEVYYRLGMILPAEHCTFESLVSNRKGPNVKVLQRLSLTNILRRDAATADKYLRYLDHSLFYRKWARQQRKNLALAMADSSFHIPGTPLPVSCKNFFIPYQVPEYTLLMTLESNPRHLMAFEYLMAYSMLQKDLEKVKWCMDNYYGYFNYPNIPAHYEEALLVYKDVFEEGPDFFTQYPVSNATRERYDRYLQAVNAARGSERRFNHFQKQFSNTYWYYLNLIDPSALKKQR